MKLGKYGPDTRIDVAWLGENTIGRFALRKGRNLQICQSNKAGKEVDATADDVFDPHPVRELFVAWLRSVAVVRT